MDPNDLRNVLYIQSMIDYVKKKALDYYFTQKPGLTETSEDRLAKTKTIRAAIQTLADPLTVNADIYGCPSGWRCIDGICVEEYITDRFDWPETDFKIDRDPPLNGYGK